MKTIINTITKSNETFTSKFRKNGGLEIWGK